MLKLRPVILLLAFALLVQNTCPHGFAGKTSVTPACGHCSLRQLHASHPDPQLTISSSPSPVHYPLFVFAVPKTVHTFQLDPIKSARLVLVDRYKDALPDELLRPPRA
ncbi:MAG TPA: hypothetical protein VL197_12460 [Nitrospirota bacterium]|nr:hypothetical protein [Nitrospirota bacterium]